jgi:dihydroxyacetone kinase phosphoprotein-dependent L subunit
MADPQKTKKLINNPDDLIAELIDGMVGAHPDLLRKEGRTGRAVVAVDGPRDGKVGIVIGGGSGHEPLFSGYVGRGLADACAVGNIFASPSPDQICDAARAADGGAGVLFLYGNYTGDVMNFDMAAERLKAEGIIARSVLVTDDVASAPADRKSERRGIAGDIFVFKVAGAAADKGLPLDEVERLARFANDHTASMGVALGPCSLPQTATPNFQIGCDEMEIGMGIHGEPGIERIKLETADAVADRLLNPVLADITAVKGDAVAVIINGLGSTALLELYILHRRVREVLTQRSISIHRSWVGEYATSLEMAGASVTLIKLNDELRDLLEYPCRTIALQVGESETRVAAEKTARNRVKASTATIKTTTTTEALLTDGAITPHIFSEMMQKVALRISESKEVLCELDGAIGDADHGITMETGWQAISAALELCPPDATISAMCSSMSDAFLESVGASAGPLYATGLERAGAAVSDRLNLDAGAMVRWLEGMTQGIVLRGGASEGEKTMVDVWIPASEAARSALDLGADLSACLSAANDAAEKGAQATTGMRAARGRASKLGERAIGHLDPGAASAAIIIRTLLAAHIAQR